ncbi:MAG: DUF2185 domain-containing protein [Clostridiales bacterium]|jgi:hypothetical protein|nr:DUF2185 domain-containing protein [Clostridiales bacterium]
MKTKYGLAVTSNNIINKKGNVLWCTRSEPNAPIDTGWTFLSDIDTEEFLADDNNLSLVTFETVIDIEPAVARLVNLPIGADLALVKKDNDIYFVDVETSVRII